MIVEGFAIAGWVRQSESVLVRRAGWVSVPALTVGMRSARPERPVGELLGDLVRLRLDEAWTDGILPDLGSRYGAHEFCTSVGFAA